MPTSEGDGEVVKNPPASAGAGGSIPGLGRSPGEENSYLLQYSCLENPMHRGATLEKTLMLGKTEGRRRKEQQRTRWLDGITNSMDTS